jgi:MoaA/NifB/PqqE/SkfB family radical SAM enzyme
MVDMQQYINYQVNGPDPRLPLKGSLDLTYRCNNNCRHCWLRISPGEQEKKEELSADEIKATVDEARKLGCRKWSISGGEPMLRPDFAEIFDYITSRSVSYSINTNGTLITPEIAELMRRSGRKMIALYGGTPEVHDHITRNPGSFQQTMNGFSLLKETSAEFIVQIIPMRDNYHQYKDMVSLAKSLSPYWRVGAAWLYLSASGNQEKNAEIAGQRLSPKEVVELDKPDLSYEEGLKPHEHREYSSCHSCDDRLFARCISGRRDFHIDPYGQMSFCGYIKDPALLYDLRNGSFRKAWEEFIPSLSDKVIGGREYLEGCGSCELREHCRWCPIYGFLEHRRFSSPVDYLCNVAREKKKFKEDWDANHRRYFTCGGITIRVDSDLILCDEMFHPTMSLFAVSSPGNEIIEIRHHADLPYLEDRDLGEVVYKNSLWTVRKKGDSWIYLKEDQKGGVVGVTVFNRDYTRARIYGPLVRKEESGDLNQAYGDQIFLTQTALAEVLSGHRGCFLHSSGVIIDGRGVLFLGQSTAGKSTIREMILSSGCAKPLCDDRNVVRSMPEGLFAHGTWALKDLSDVSAASVPIAAIMFVEQADENCIIPIHDRMEAAKRILPRLIRPVESAQWWSRSLELVGEISSRVPCYRVRFDLSGRIVERIKERFLPMSTVAGP